MTMDNVKPYLDVAAVANAFATVMGWLPTIAAALSIVWLGIQIYDRFFRKRGS